jgi:TonB family protein
MNDYPSVALQKELEGTSGFSVIVGPDGRVSDCVITSSSGYSELDLATCTNVQRRARFEPALDASGRPTIGKYANRVRWQIPNFVPQIIFPRGPMMLGTGWTRLLATDFPPQAIAEKHQGRVKIELAISSAGVAEGCKVLKSTAYSDLDAESCKIALTHAKFDPALDLTGKPTAGRMQTELNWRIPSEGGRATVSAEFSKPFTLPIVFRPKAGGSTLSFIVAADGSLLECTGSTNMETQFFSPEALCKLKVKMEPYIDVNDQKVPRRVVIKTTVEIEDVK